MQGFQVLSLFALMHTSLADDCLPNQLDCSALTEVLGCLVALKATVGSAKYGKELLEAAKEEKKAREIDLKKTKEANVESPEEGKTAIEESKEAVSVAEANVQKAALPFGYGGATSAAIAVVEIGCSFWDEHEGKVAMSSALHSSARRDLAHQLKEMFSKKSTQLDKDFYHETWRHVVLAVKDVDILRASMESVVHDYIEGIGAAQVATASGIVGGVGCAVAGAVTWGVGWAVCGVVSGVATVSGGVLWEQNNKLKRKAQQYLNKFTDLKTNLNAFKHDIYCQPHTELCGLKAGVTAQDLNADMKTLEEGASEISNISLFSAASNQVSIQKLIARAPQWVILASGALCILVSLGVLLSHSKRAIPSDSYVVAPE